MIIIHSPSLSPVGVWHVYIMSDQPAATTPSTRPIAGSRWARRGQQAAAAAAQAKETAEKEEKKDETPADPAPEETPADNGTSIWGKLRAAAVGNNEGFPSFHYS